MSKTPTDHRIRAVVLNSLDPADTALDVVVNWLAAHPRATCALVCALALIPLMMDAPR